MSDPAARWQRLEAVVQSALERPFELRAAFLAEACRGDDELHREAEALLAREPRAADFLAADVGALAAAAITYSPGGTPTPRDARLSIGDTLGAYEIRAQLGAGGMGEVYRALDHSLGREVAIKLLPAVFSSDPERLARFEREARLLASLAHPHIGAIYGLQQSGNLRAIVLELIDGETLEAHLRRGPFTIDQALSIAVQIAGALDHAHRRGVTHRDLKPANIMLTKSGARLLDFGLARWSGHVSGLVTRTAAAQSQRPQGVETLTIEGTILGTPHYMAPEQLEGRTVDARADVFAFGAVLYEMIGGKQAFAGGSTAAVMAAVLNTEPSFAELSQIPPPVERVIRKCLAKDADDRWQTTRDLLDELKWIADARAQHLPQTIAVAPAPRRLRLGHVAVAALLAVTISVAGWAAWDFRSSADNRRGAVTRLSIAPQAPVNDFAVSPDGSTFAYTHSVEGSIMALFIRRLDQFEVSRVPGTEGANSPMFSPDGRWVAFFSRQAGAARLLKVDVQTNAAPILLAEVGEGWLPGGEWLSDGTIVFSLPNRGLQRVPDGGGASTDLLALKPDEADHHNPVMLPGGKAVLFTVHDSKGQFHVAVETLATKQRKVIIQSAYDARYLPSGQLVFARNRIIVAAPFDLRTLERTGPEITLIEDVQGAPTDGRGGYQLSSSGTLVYSPIAPTNGRTLTWVDRSGAETPLPLRAAGYNSPSIAPNGRQIAFSIGDGAGRDIYIYDLDSGSEVRFTRSGNNQTPAWSRDGKYLTYSSGSPSDPLGRTLVREPIDQSSGGQELVSGGVGLVPGSWAPRDERLFFTDAGTTAEGTRIFAVAPETPARAEPIADGPGTQRHPSVSPDGRWLAFTSDETGRTEVFVQSLLARSKPRQLSIDGGRLPRWSSDGREISFRTFGRMMAVAVDPMTGVAVARPRLLFQGPYVTGSTTWGVDSDRAPDGRFLMIKPGRDEQVPPLRVVVNWTAEIRSRVTATK